MARKTIDDLKEGSLLWSGAKAEQKLPAVLPDHDGETYESGLDKTRLNSQLRRVHSALSDGQWHTLRELADKTGDPEASISARLRDLRKPKFGEFVVEHERVGDSGLFKYRMGDKNGT